VTGSVPWPGTSLAGQPRDAGALLHTDPDVLRAPRNAAVAVLEAIRAALARESVPSERVRGFADVADRALAAAPDALDAVLGDPTFYRWTRTAHRLLHDGPREAFERHLDSFRAFAVGIAVRTGETWTFRSPLVVPLPWAVPASRVSLEGEGSVRVLGTRGGLLRVARETGPEAALALGPRGRDPRTGIAVRECPVARRGSFALPLHPHAFAGTDLPFAEPALAAGIAYQERHAGLVTRALEALERHAPAAFDGLRRAARWCALKPWGAGGYDDFSHPELPGSFVASAVADPLVLADHLVHEGCHIRLSMIEETGALFESGGDEPSFYSPWRDRPRALHGILHGVYVFTSVARYWASVFRSGDGSDAERAFAADRLVRLPLQLALARDVLRRHARLAPLGRAIFERLSVEVDETERRVREAGPPDDARALAIGDDGACVPETSARDGRALRAREAVLEHAARNDPEGRHDAVLAEALGTAPARA
jgi:HEXXH motif-containing protein